MIDHISIAVHNYEEALVFYDQTLEILGYKKNLVVNVPGKKAAGYGLGSKPSFWISPMGKAEEVIGAARGFHIAFIAPSAEAVNEWHKKCLELGGKDNGAPGVRPYYHPGYYGAYIIDPNGWRLEAVMHTFKKD